MPSRVTAQGVPGGSISAVDGPKPGAGLRAGRRALLAFALVGGAAPLGVAMIGIGSSFGASALSPGASALSPGAPALTPSATAEPSPVAPPAAPVTAMPWADEAASTPAPPAEPSETPAPEPSEAPPSETSETSETSEASETSAAGEVSEAGEASETDGAVEDPGVAPLGFSTPVHLSFDRLGIESDLMTLGLNPDQTVQVPPSARYAPAGWFDGRASPGEVGPAVILGHVDSVYGPGVFYRLRETRAGDRIVVSRADGSVAAFTVDRVGSYPRPEFPTEDVYGESDHAGLRLITCGGPYDRKRGGYQENVVVFASLTGTW